MYESWQDYYNLVVYERADPRTADYPLVNTPLTPFCTGLVYVILCLNVKCLTSHLPAYSLRALMLVYNAILMVVSAYMTKEFLVTAYRSKYEWLCQPVDYSDDPLAIRMINVCWIYYFTKYVELAETVMFALRKKYSQISFLHVYHHTTMIQVWYFVLKYAPGGTSAAFAVYNSFVHVVMYTYYFLSALGHFMIPYLWWKKYITILQLTQFVMLFFQSIYMLCVNCEFTPYILYAMIFYGMTLWMLFLDFFNHAYKSTPKPIPISTVTTDVGSQTSEKRDTAIAQSGAEGQQTAAASVEAAPTDNNDVIEAHAAIEKQD